MRYPEQHFNLAGARAQATMLTLAAIALIIPAAYHGLVGELYAGGEKSLSISISLVLLVVYCMFLLFSLWTHPSFFAASTCQTMKQARNLGHSHGPSPCSRYARRRLRG
jgi:Ca2+:H+ antiporter